MGKFNSMSNLHKMKTKRQLKRVTAIKYYTYVYVGIKGYVRFQDSTTPRKLDYKDHGDFLYVCYNYYTHRYTCTHINMIEITAQVLQTLQASSTLYRRIRNSV